MKAKLLLIFSLFFIEEWAVATNNDSNRHHVRIGIGSTPKQSPCYFSKDIVLYTSPLNINFDKMADFVTVTITNEFTGEVVYSQLFLKVKNLELNLSSLPEGKYLMNVYLNGCVINREITIK